MIFGAIEAGGTKIICAIGNEKGEIVELIRMETATPEISMPKVIEFFQNKEIEAIGIGTFGPAGVNEKQVNYGKILDTPKKAWAHYDFLGELKKHFEVPMIFDTDVNGAAVAEHLWGSAKDVDSCLYITVGTGIGGGAFVNGKLLHGLLHPEMGHIFLNRHPEDDFEGNCLFHGACLEGMASGVAMEKRWGQKAYLLPPDHKAWEIESYYLAQGIIAFISTLAPEKIILGGGVMGQEHLLGMVKQQVKILYNHYIQLDQLEDSIDDYIVKPALGENAGTYGALALAIMAKEKIGL